MSTADWNRWLAGCRPRRGFGLTAGDTMHCGLADYTEPFPCPNGLPIDTRKPGESPRWRARVERAKRDIAEWNRYFANEDRLIWNAMNDVQSEVEVAVPVADCVSEFESRMRSFLLAVESFKKEVKS